MEHLRKFNDNYVGDYEFNDDEEEMNGQELYLIRY